MSDSNKETVSMEELRDAVRAIGAFSDDARDLYEIEPW